MRLNRQRAAQRHNGRARFALVQVGFALLCPGLGRIGLPLDRYQVRARVDRERDGDAEGSARRRNVLFDRGVFSGFLYDVATAAACGCPGTASACRDYSSAPKPGASNVEIEAGDADPDRLVREMKEGLVVYGFIGAGLSNVLAGEITLNVNSGFKVESGQVVGRVKDVMVAGNVYELLSTVDAVGSAQEDLGDYFLPFVRFPALKVATGEA